MHQKFADWYRLASVEPSEEQLLKRWEGVEKAVANADRDGVIARVQLYLGDGPSEDQLTGFQRSFKDVDDTFRLIDNKVELQVLAGVCLATMLEGRASKLNDFTALALRCASFGAELPAKVVRELPALSESWLDARSSAVRKTVDKVSVTPGKEAETVIEEGDLPTLATSVRAALDEVPSAILSSVQKAFDSVTHIQRAMREELDALWWVVGDYSGDLRLPFSKVKAAALPLVAAKELADHTYFTPGFLAADALLAKVLDHGNARSKSDRSIKEAVDETEREWRESVREAYSDPSLSYLAPVLLAFNKSLDTEDSDTWGPVYKKVGRVDLEETHSRVSLARQLYNELLLSRMTKGF